MKIGPTASLWLPIITLVIGLDGCGSPGSAPPIEASISISPVTAVAGSPGLTLTVIALGSSTFSSEPHNASEVVWSANGSDTLLATTFVSSTKLTAAIPADLLANSVTASVAVETGDPIGSEPLLKSASVTFSVTPLGPGQVLISSLSPASATVGSSDVALTISGSGFVSGFLSVVWSVAGTQDFLTQASGGSDTQLNVVIPAALMTEPVTADISVQIFQHAADSIPRALSNSVAFSVTGP